MYILLKKSPKKNKRFVAYFYDKKLNKPIKIHFGSKMSNYMIHQDEERKTNYLKRHKSNEDWSNFMSAGSLSRYLLWGDKTLWKSLSKFSEKFGLKILQSKEEISELQKNMKYKLKE